VAQDVGPEFKPQCSKKKKKIKAKRARGMIEVIEHLHSKYKVLSSIPGTTKKKKKEKLIGIPLKN
jgi:hypothetical protein